ncbi:hypothetical protein C3E80_16505 [Cronobacter malonaticus]|uniref:Peptidoglycan binding-like domain-containing protein n=1 Tax=Cronobacter malonaticus TaxID=413503 RepID=A0A423XTW4_9ENTR|nr:peptidoglycan-binding protein [Cronobacter malonaticus]ELY4601048.1 peptidoglycan-binding protein [Cronobacter malonaticus]NCH99539.1 peptidoglycan-binding protein [Cronobacter malonaticus]ROW59978.1 hypothetical protein C3E80_16505 [Cronobacter malonaticus]RRA40616.1 hypothetical protein C4882_12400 [Cronobacter malonaticus]
MRYRTSHIPRVFRIKQSVGLCGKNDPQDIKILQHQIIDAGYSFITGRTLRPTGMCDADTTEAIRWYQRLLNMSPSGLINVTDIWFMQALEAIANYSWRNVHTSGPLTVGDGQLTFDAEGVDYITAVVPFKQQRYPFFSRILHWPGTGLSGVTLGRGYDMGSRSAGEILAMLRHAGIEEYKAQICAKAAGLRNREAQRFVEFYGPFVGEITHRQQVNLFIITWQQNTAYGKGVYDRRIQKLRLEHAVSWDNIDKRIRDVFLDTIYKGNVNAGKMIDIMAQGGTKKEIIDFIKNDPALRSDQRRTVIRSRYLE